MQKVLFKGARRLGFLPARMISNHEKTNLKMMYEAPQPPAVGSLPDSN